MALSACLGPHKIGQLRFTTLRGTALPKVKNLRIRFATLLLPHFAMKGKRYLLSMSKIFLLLRTRDRKNRNRLRSAGVWLQVVSLIFCPLFPQYCWSLPGCRPTPS
jgi:hypothetical protein